MAPVRGDEDPEAQRFKHPNKLKQKEKTFAKIGTRFATTQHNGIVPALLEDMVKRFRGLFAALIVTLVISCTVGAFDLPLQGNGTAYAAGAQQSRKNNFVLTGDAAYEFMQRCHGNPRTELALFRKIAAGLTAKIVEIRIVDDPNDPGVHVTPFRIIMDISYILDDRSMVSVEVFRRTLKTILSQHIEESSAEGIGD